MHLSPSMNDGRHVTSLSESILFLFLDSTRGARKCERRSLILADLRGGMWHFLQEVEFF